MVWVVTVNLRPSWKISGRSKTFAVDIFSTGNTKFRIIAENKSHRIYLYKIEKLPFYFSALKLEMSVDYVLVHDNPYLRQLDTISNLCDVISCRFARGSLVWIYNKVYACISDISKLEQGTETKFKCEKKKIIKIFNRTTDY